MLISDRHRYIFVHVWKVAGMSIQRALQRADRRWMNPFIWALAKLGLVAAPSKMTYARLDEHITAAELKQKLPATVFDRFFKFAFVRNPWDLEVSAYHFALDHPWHHKHEQFKAMRNFDEYVEWRVRAKGLLQSDFVTDPDGRLLMDYVGRYERLHEDFDHICQVIGVDAKLPHVNPSKHHDYRTYYTPRTRDMLAEAVRADIEMFGYDFDGLADLPPDNELRRGAA